jgi:hypothetical protein
MIPNQHPDESGQTNLIFTQRRKDYAKEIHEKYFVIPLRLSAFA